MRPLDTVLKWARLDDRDARAEAAHELGKLARDPGYRDAVRPELVRLLGDADATVAAVAREALAQLPRTADRPEASMVAQRDLTEKQRRAAMRNRRAPRVTKTKTTHLAGFLADVESENVDGADDYVFMLTSGDWAVLAAELPGKERALQEAILEEVGYGPACGLFLLLEQLAGPRGEVAAEAIAKMCERIAGEVALTAGEWALVKVRGADVVEPFLIEA